MPNGFGFNWPGYPTAPAYRLLAKVPLAGGLFGATQTAVRQLAAAGGVEIALSGGQATASGRAPAAGAAPATGIGAGAPVAASGSSGDGALIGAVALVALAGAGVATLAGRRRRRRRAGAGARVWRRRPGACGHRGVG